LRAAASTELSWLWQGYLVPGGVTLLTSQWKAGKTTLLSLLLARLKQGGSLGGLSVSRGKALVLSEEEPALWCQRGRLLDLAGQVHWLCRPFLGKPTREQWLQMLDDVGALRKDTGLDLFVIDTLAAFLPCPDENNATAMLQALAPLRLLSAAGLAVLLLHHPRRAPSAAGQAARGSGALLGFADILIEMGARRGADKSRVRRLRAWSRYQGTPGDLLMELTADGTDYLPVDEAAVAEQDDSPAVPDALRLLLEGAHGKLTRQDLLDGWLPDFQPAPDGSTLNRWLVRAVKSGQVCRDGSGRRNEPFRYWLPQREDFLRPDGGSVEAMQAWNDRCLAELFARLEQTSGATPTDQMPPTGNDDSKGVPAVAAVLAEVLPLQPVPPPEPGSESASSASPTPEALPSQAGQPDAWEAVRRLPYPFNTMNPADVPEEVWKQARAAQKRPL
jgi:hypothetical protein